MKTLSLLISCWLLLSLANPSGIAAAMPQAVEPQAAAQQAADDLVTESLESMGSLPWYDRESRQVNPVDVAPRLDDSVNRDSRWVPKPKQAKKASRSSNNFTTGNTGPASYPFFLQWIFANFSTIIGWTLFAISLVALITMLVFLVMKMEPTEDIKTATSSSGDSEPTAEELAKLEHLPIEVATNQGNLLERADQLRQTGRLGEAIIYLFSQRLLQLDRCHAIRLSRGKTNQQYLRELRGRADLQGVMQRTVASFERSFFGGYSLTTEEYDRIRNEQASFDAFLAASREAA
ncbi:DUF4129 domain-containing protein [Planctomycetaceae bacterium SH139]